jgi:putative Holliday junction resolvase
MSRILALDPGSKRIGAAVSDPTGVVAQGLDPIARSRKTDWVDEVEKLVAHYQAAEVVMGLPRNMDGSEGPAAADARAMAETLRDRLRVPVTLWDERLTTVAAQRAFREAGMNSKRSRGRVDTVAAVLILQGYLDCRARSAGEKEGS